MIDEINRAFEKARSENSEPNLVTAKPRRIKRLLISGDILLEIIKCFDGEQRLKSEGLPEDARVVGFVTDSEPWGARPSTVTMFVESETFEPINIGDVPPLLDVTFTRL